MQTYRASLDVYRRVLQLRVRRQMRGESVAVALPEPETAPPSPGLNGATLLTPREREVATLIARGYTNKQIAEVLVITRGTTANHVAHILTKLLLANRTQVAAYLIGGPVLQSIPRVSESDEHFESSRNGAPDIELLSGRRQIAL